jgi:hypothetical protein
MLAEDLHHAPTPTEHWLVDARGRLHVAGAEENHDPASVARGRTHTELGYGYIQHAPDAPDALDRVLNALDARYPNHRWFIER